MRLSPPIANIAETFRLSALKTNGKPSQPVQPPREEETFDVILPGGTYTDAPLSKVPHMPEIHKSLNH